MLTLEGKFNHKRRSDSPENYKPGRHYLCVMPGLRLASAVRAVGFQIVARVPETAP